VTLTFDLLTLKVVSESRVTWAIPLCQFQYSCVLDLDPMYATDRQTSDVRQKHRLIRPPIRGGGIITVRYFEKHSIRTALGSWNDLQVIPDH